MTHAAPDSPASFVNGITWTFIGLSVLTVLLAAMLYALFAHLLPQEPLRATLADAIQLKLLPPSALKLLEYLPAICAALFILSLLTLVASVALLKRKNWGRIAFAWIMIATALAHFAGVVLPFYLMHDVSAALNHMPPDIRSVASSMMKMLSVMSMVMGIVFGVAFAWIARRMFSTEIAREFGLGSHR